MKEDIMQDKSLAPPITQEECDAVASLFERVIKIKAAAKLKEDYHLWDALKTYFESRKPVKDFNQFYPLPKGITFEPVTKYDFD